MPGEIVDDESNFITPATLRHFSAAANTSKSVQDTGNNYSTTTNKMSLFLMDDQGLPDDVSTTYINSSRDAVDADGLRGSIARVDPAALKKQSRLLSTTSSFYNTTAITSTTINTAEKRNIDTYHLRLRFYFFILLRRRLQSLLLLPLIQAEK